MMPFFIISEMFFLNLIPCSLYNCRSCNRHLSGHFIVGPGHRCCNIGVPLEEATKSHVTNVSNNVSAYCMWHYIVIQEVWMFALNPKPPPLSLNSVHSQKTQHALDNPAFRPNQRAVPSQSNAMLQVAWSGIYHMTVSHSNYVSLAHPFIFHSLGHTLHNFRAKKQSLKDHHHHPLQQGTDLNPPSRTTWVHVRYHQQIES